MKTYRLLSALWLCCLLGSAIFLVWRLAQGPAFETNLLSLLPHHERDAASEKATEAFLDQGNRKLLFLLGHTLPSESQKAALRFAEQLRNFPYFSALTVERTETMDDFYDLYFPYRYALTAQATVDELQTPSGLNDFLQSNRTWLSTPMGMMVNPDWQADPMGFFPRVLMNFPKTLSRVSFNEGMLSVTAEGKTYTLIEASLEKTPFQMKDQQDILNAIHSAEGIVKSEIPGIDFRFTGMLRFAAATAQSLSSEISTVGTLSLFLVILLVLWMFRSWVALALCILPIFSGCLVALALGLLIYPKLNLLTLGFGVSLIGVCEDYGIHLLVKHQNTGQSPFMTLRKLHPALIQGAGTTLLGFLGLALPAFPGLRQMALFASFGVVGALTSVYLILPFALKPSHHPVHIKLYQWIERLRLPQPKGRWIFIFALACTALTAVGLTHIRFDDNLKLLQNTPSSLIDNQQAIQRDLGMFELGYYFWIKGSSTEAVLEKLEKTEKRLKDHTAALSSFSLARFIPSQHTQEERDQEVKIALRKRIKTIEHDYLDLYFDTATATRFKTEIQNENAKTLHMQDFLKHPATQGLRHFWFDDGEGHIFSPVLLGGIQNVSKLDQLADPADGIYFINHLARVEQVFKRYRVLSSKMVLVFYSLILAWLAWRFGIYRGTLVFLPAFLSGVITLGVLGLLGHPLNLFHLFSLLLVLGLGIDYAIFFAEENAFSPATVISVFISALSTFFSFGLLAFCATPVLQSIGLTVTIGLISAVLLAPLALYRKGRG